MAIAAELVDSVDAELRKGEENYSESSIAVGRLAVEKAEAEGESSDVQEAVFALSRELVFSPNLSEVREGIRNLKRLSAEGYNAQDSMFYEVVGYLRSGSFSRARECVGLLTETFPWFERGVALRDVMVRRVEERARLGMIGAGVLGAIVLGVGIYWWWSSSSKESARPSWRSSSASSRLSAHSERLRAAARERLAAHRRKD